jgi:hypothetical protein
MSTGKAASGYVYIQSEPGLYTVGFYKPDGQWEPESDHGTKSAAAHRVAYLNGHNCSIDEALNSGDGSYRP